MLFPSGVAARHEGNMLAKRSEYLGNRQRAHTALNGIVTDRCEREVILWV